MTPFGFVPRLYSPPILTLLINHRHYVTDDRNGGAECSFCLPAENQLYSARFLIIDRADQLSDCGQTLFNVSSSNDKGEAMMLKPVGDLTDKIILVTGGAQGIGGATAQLCAARGAQVIITDIKTEKGEALAETIRADGGKAAFYSLDVRDQLAVEQVFTQVQEAYGRLDVLICAAGVLAGALLQPDEFPIETFDFVMEVNVKGMFLCVKYAMPLLSAAEQGVILLVGSGAGVIGGSSSIAYGTSKGAVNGMGMTLERHLAGRGIRVNVICPGGIETEL
jgi:NAD(P)-dependent dehydrogenase (short-subunit alcohol dehydrogenase family)